MHDASGSLGDLVAAPTPEVTERLAREIVLMLLRRADLDEARESTSAFARLSVEVVTAAAEKVTQDEEQTRMFAEQRRRLDLDEIVTSEAATIAVARRWADL